MSPDSSTCCFEGGGEPKNRKRDVGERVYSGEAGDRGGWDGEAPPLIIPVDLGGGDWLEQVIEAAGMVVGVG